MEFLKVLHLDCETVTSGLYYKRMTIVNYPSSVVNKLEALLTDDAGVVIYDRRVFIVQATGYFLYIVTLPKVAKASIDKWRCHERF